ncbi:hypothetical protein AB5I41_10935 [Sphingomonas sp. MMS24-JH45]
MNSGVALRQSHAHQGGSAPASNKETSGMWSFQTDPESEGTRLDHRLVRRDVEPLDHILGSQWNIHDPLREADPPAPGGGQEARAVGMPSRPRAGRQGLWPAPKLALMNEQFGPFALRPDRVRGAGARHRQLGILAHYGSPSRRRRIWSRCWRTRWCPASRSPSRRAVPIRSGSA